MLHIKQAAEQLSPKLRNAFFFYIHTVRIEWGEREREKKQMLWDLQIIQPKQLKIQPSISKSNSAEKQSRGLPGKSND